MKKIYPIAIFLLISFGAYSQNVIFSPQNPLICYWDSCVQFSNQSQNVVASFWNFGDPASGANDTSTATSPLHCFAGGAGSYTVSLTCFFSNNTNGSATTTVTIADDSAAFNWTNAGNNTISFTDVSGGNPVTWSWDFGDATTSTLQSPVHLYASSGNYNVRLVILTTYGCLDTIYKTVSATPNGISSVNNLCDFSFYPNPSVSHKFFISTNSAHAEDLKIENALGKIIYSEKIYDKKEIDLSAQPAGIYFLQIGNGGVRKIILE